MKAKNILLILLTVVSISAIAQSSDVLQHQILIRDAGGAPIPLANVTLFTSIVRDSIMGTTVYSESHNVRSNQFGLANIKIGAGTVISGDFDSISWYNGSWFLKQELDMLDGNGSVLMGTTQLVSTPYAMHSKTAEGLVMESRDGTMYIIDVSNEGEITTNPLPPDCAPIAGFTCSSAVGPMPYTVSFIDTSLYQPISWHWDFGDGLSSTEQNPSHKYWVEGWYTVSLSVYNGLTYDTATYENYIHVTGFCPSTVTDIDGNVYSTVLIGDYKCWMQENLKVTHYADGTPVPFVPETSDWAALGCYDSAYCYYYNNPASEYGALYTWAAATGNQRSKLVPSGVQGICPDGWHLPSSLEFLELSNSLGGSDVAGGKLKEAGFEHWNSPNTGATNESGFTGLPGGYRKEDGGWFYNSGYYAYFWSTAHSYSVFDKRYMILYYDRKDLQIFYWNSQNGLSVRCMKDY